MDFMATSLKFLVLIFIVQNTCTGSPLTVHRGAGIRERRNGTVGTRIIGGSDAKLGDFPWQVSLQEPIFGNPGLTDKFCGGVILNPTTVLTAAHCVERFQVKPASLMIIAGIINIENPDGTQQTVVASKIRIHERYDIPDGSTDNDIAVITLSKALTFNTLVNKIKIAPASTIPTGVCTAVGWGAHNPDDDEQRPDKLQKVDLDIVPRPACEDAWGDWITNGMICANKDGKGTCYADSGSGLRCTNAGGIYLAGLVSWGQPQPHCAADPSLPSVFTNVAAYADWIGPH